MLKQIVSIEKKPVTVKNFLKRLGLVVVIQFFVIVISTFFPERASSMAGSLLFFSLALSMMLFVEVVEAGIRANDKPLETDD